MKADFHVHSTASDGTLSPAQVVAHAHANGVDVLALADHDTVNGLAEARIAAEKTGVTLVNAVELSSADDGADVHVLAYFVDPNSEDLRRRLTLLRSAREERAHEMVAALRDAGYSISLEQVREIAQEGALGRSHVARALVASGNAESVRDAFVRLIGRGRPFYVAKRTESPTAVVAQIRELGALPVLAHPGVTQVDALIPAMISAGLAGLEAYHGDHTAEQCAHYASLAAELGLLVTGGSDYHGPGGPNPDIGDISLPSKDAERLLEAGAALGR
jgi:predicted metal-dependent phosphoesterase TrpH